MSTPATGYGFKYAAIRRPIQNADTLDYVRMTIFVVWSEDPHGAPDEEQFRKLLRAQVGIDVAHSHPAIKSESTLPHCHHGWPAILKSSEGRCKYTSFQVGSPIRRTSWRRRSRVTFCAQNQG